MKTIVLVLALIALCSATKQAAVVTNYVDDIIEGITEEQVSHETLYEDSMEQCNDEFAYREQAISDGSDALARATAHHDRCSLNVADATADLAQVRQNIIGIENTVTKLQNRREEGRREYNRVSDALGEAIVAVEGCFAFVDQMENNASFLQTSKNMIGAFKSVAKSGYGASMAGVMAAMVELSQSYDAGKVAEVRRLFNQLLEELRSSRTLAIDNEEQAQGIFESAMTEYAGIVGTLKTQEAQLLDFQVTSENCVDQEAFVIASSSQKVSSNQNLLEYAQAMCQSFTDEYETATAARKHELTLLRQIRAYVVDRADDFDASGLGLEITGQLQEEFEADEEGQQALVQTGALNNMLVQLQQGLPQKKSNHLRRK